MDIRTNPLKSPFPLDNMENYTSRLISGSRLQIPPSGDIHLATDGSHCPLANTSGFGVTMADDPALVDRYHRDGISVASRVPGKQTINRAEGFGLTVACTALHDRTSGNTHIHVDSQLTLDALAVMLADIDTMKVVQNYSVIIDQDLCIASPQVPG